MVIDELIVRKGTTNMPIDSLDNQMIDEIIYEGQSFHFAKHKDLTGTSEIVADNAVAEPIISFGVSGSSRQQTYSGKNLFDKNNIDKTRVLGNGKSEFSAISTGTYYCSIVSCKEKTTYIKSGDFGTNVMAFLDENEIFLYPASSVATNTPFTTPSNCKYIALNVLVANAPYDNCQIEKGSVVTEYEPYVGGIASPNPEYPQTIDNAGDNGLTCVLRGNNLFDRKDLAIRLTNGYYGAIRCDFELKPSTTYTISFDYDFISIDKTSGTTWGIGRGPQNAYLADIVYSVNFPNFTKGRANGTFTTPSNLGTYKYLHLRVPRNDSTVSCEVNLSNFMLNYGTVPEAYEPYFNQSLAISPSVTLADGTVLDLRFSKYKNADYLSMEEGKVKYFAYSTEGDPTKPLNEQVENIPPIEYDLTETDLGVQLLEFAKTQDGTNILEIKSEIPVSQTELSYWRQIIPNE